MRKGLHRVSVNNYGNRGRIRTQSIVDARDDTRDRWQEEANRAFTVLAQLWADGVVQPPRQAGRNPHVRAMTSTPDQRG